MHAELGLVLSVYVDDFNMAGPASTIMGVWRRIKTVIKLDGPSTLSEYSGCGHRCLDVPRHLISHNLVATTCFLSNHFDNAETLADKDSGRHDATTTKSMSRATPDTSHGAKSSMNRGVAYNMSDFTTSCVDLCCELTGTLPEN